LYCDQNEFLALAVHYLCHLNAELTGMHVRIIELFLILQPYFYTVSFTE